MRNELGVRQTVEGEALRVSGKYKAHRTSQCYKNVGVEDTHAAIVGRPPSEGSNAIQPFAGRVQHITEGIQPATKEVQPVVGRLQSTLSKLFS